MVKSPKFVEPEEKSTGYKFKRVYDEKVYCFVSKTVQTTFQHIPISKTLTALFSDPEFENFYINFNTNKDHICGDGVYHNFCCGEVCRSNPFFKQNPFAIQCRLFTDEFEPFDALKSKAGVRKVNAFYLQINNLPANLLSKTDNIFLVAMSDSSDSKNELADVENVIETIVADLKSIESNGIITASGKLLKVALVCCSFDNLGGNVLFGFSGGFMANFYCRMCTSKRQECQKLVTEDHSTIRNESDYNSMIRKLQSNSPPSLTESKGIKSPCALNSLSNFHILSNVSVDLMHDIFEGCAGFLLEQVFNYCVEKKIASIDNLRSLVHCFDYGIKRDKIPSKLNLEKKNVGQNATQAKCLMMNLPFILFRYQNELKLIWLAVESMLQIIQILMSDVISEAQLERLSNLISTHLKCYQEFFGQVLKPKHHFLIHYPRIIRCMGPVVKFWAMRMEAKHQYFKRIIYSTKNFINIKKTMAQKHQEKFYFSPAILCDEIVRGKEYAFIAQIDFDKFISKLELNFADNIIEGSQIIKSLRINDRQYKPGLLIAAGCKFYEIEYILSIQNEFLFLCDRNYDIVSYESFFNAFKIADNEECSIFNIKDMKIKKSFEKRNVQGDLYVIVDCLSTFEIKSN